MMNIAPNRADATGSWAALPLLATGQRATKAQETFTQFEEWQL